MVVGEYDIKFARIKLALLWERMGNRALVSLTYSEGVHISAPS